MKQIMAILLLAMILMVACSNNKTTIIHMADSDGINDTEHEEKLLAVATAKAEGIKIVSDSLNYTRLMKNE